MWWRRVMGLSLTIILVLSSSIVLSQSNKLIPDRHVLSIDSLRAKVGSVPRILKQAPVVIKREAPGSEEASLSPNQPPATSGSSSDQWVTYRFSYTNWSWQIRRPGTYAGKVVEGFVESNGDVIVDFAGFGNLGLYSDPHHTADNYYAIARPSAGIRDLMWMTPSELNANDLRVGNADPTWSSWVLWHRVDIIEDTSAEDIDGGGTISIKLQNNFPYLDNYPFEEPTRILQ
jgi:hypothetical protein